MPHLVLEISPGLEDLYDMNGVCKALFDALIQDPAIPNPKALKIRASIVPFAYLGTDAQSFIHGTFYFLAGRDAPTQSRLTNLVLNELSTLTPKAINISIDAQDMNPNIYTKRT